MNNDVPTSVSNLLIWLSIYVIIQLVLHLLMLNTHFMNLIFSAQLSMVMIKTKIHKSITQRNNELLLMLNYELLTHRSAISVKTQIWQV